MDYTGDLASPEIAEREIQYLLEMANRYFAADLARKDVAWTFAGLRPLLADPKDRATSVTRDYELDLDADGPPLLSIYGGKLTTYRRLAEDVVDALAPGLGCTARPCNPAACSLEHVADVPSLYFLQRRGIGKGVILFFLHFCGQVKLQLVFP